MITAGVFVLGAGVAGYFGWLHHQQQRAERQQRCMLVGIVPLVVFLVIIDIAALFGLLYYLNHIPPDDTSLFRRYVERILNLESRKPAQWANQTVLIIALGMLFINLLIVAVIVMLGCRDHAVAPFIRIHIGDNNCCAVVANLSVGAAAVALVIAFAVRYVYRYLPI